MYENKILDCVVNYKYLGLYFSASGSFFFAQNELHKNALKAYYNSKIVWIEPYQEIVLDSKSVLDVIYAS
jgi:hypothetical protein